MIYQDYLEERREDYEASTWRTKEGTLIPISNMSSSHIRNVINHIRNSNNDFLAGYENKWIHKLKVELVRRNS